MSKLINTLTFTNVAAGGTAALPHDLNINGVSQKPDEVLLSAPGFSATATATTITVTNSNSVVASTNALVKHWHSQMRVMDPDPLVPQPFVVSPGSNLDSGFVSELTALEDYKVLLGVWSPRDTTIDDAIGLAWSSTKGLCAVADVDKSAISTNLTAWTSGAFGGLQNGSAVAWSPTLGLFAACCTTGAGNCIATSTDGVTWTGYDVGAYRFYGINWITGFGGMFVAASSDGQIVTSADGIIWNTDFITSPPGLAWSWSAYSPTLDKLIVVGWDDLVASYDGVSWSTTPLGFSSIFLNGVVWADTLGLFVAVSDTSVSGFVGSVYVSTDGITWDQIPVGSALWSVAWAHEIGQLVAVGYDNKIAYSRDGRNWTLVGIPSPAVCLWSVVWAAELGVFVVGDYSSEYVFVSPAAL